ncbi:MAG: amidohydrolase [Chloroflexota bacterium]|nr:MAG: amidohydrolase [Chloroflexota bacterium]
MNTSLLLTGGQVITMDPGRPVAEAVLIEDGRCVFVGSAVDAQQKRRPSTGVVELGGKVLLPGFIDTHIHFMSTGLSRLGPRLQDCTSVADVLSVLLRESARQPHIVRASGLDPDALAERRPPTREEIDEVIPDKLVYMAQRDGHSVVVNSLTLTYLDLPVDTLGIIRDPGTGLPTGLLRAEARRMAGQKLTLVDDQTRLQAMRIVSEECLRVGITTVHALEGHWARGDRDVQVLMEVGDKIPVKTVVYYQTRDVDRVLQLGLPRIGGCLLVDGSVASHTAALSAPYADELETSGVLYFSDQELEDFVLRAHAAGLQISMHAIGDRAIDQLLRAYERAVKVQPRSDHRHRIEHYSLATPEQIHRSARLGLCVAVQTALLGYRNQERTFLRRLGETRLRQMYRLRDIVDAGVTLVGGSDSYIGPLNPLLSMHGAVNHTVSAQSLTPYEALRGFTIDAAYAAFEETAKGSITPGKAADLVVLDANPLEVAPDLIKDIPVVATLVDGVVRSGRL